MIISGKKKEEKDNLELTNIANDDSELKERVKAVHRFQEYAKSDRRDAALNAVLAGLWALSSYFFAKGSSAIDSTHAYFVFSGMAAAKGYLSVRSYIRSRVNDKNAEDAKEEVLTLSQRKRA